MLQFLSRLNPDNIGDLYSSPSLYFDFQTKTRSVCIHRLFESQELDYGSPIILGGGGLLYWAEKLRHIAVNSKAGAITWGLGLNTHRRRAGDAYPSFFGEFDMNGVRDVPSPYRYVPCVSCLAPLFESAPQNIRVPVVIFEHYESPLKIDGLPRMNNSQPLRKVIPFLKEAEFVITNSYHGVYWATLLGKKVVAIPLDNSSRFFFFKHEPAYADETNWNRHLEEAKSYPHALEESKETNLTYAQEVASLLALKLRVRRKHWLNFWNKW